MKRYQPESFNSVGQSSQLPKNFITKMNDKDFFFKELEDFIHSL